jgi:hypothetical protein
MFGLIQAEAFHKAAYQSVEVVVDSRLALYGARQRRQDV